MTNGYDINTLFTGGGRSFVKIDQITIRDFKALKDLTFAPGYVNVFVGANGSGKSTLLEAIGVLSAAMTDRVDGNSLSRKGVRLSAPSLYKSAFQGDKRSQTISFDIRWHEENGGPEGSGEIMRYSAHLNAPSEDNAWRYHSETLYRDEERIRGRSGRSKEPYDSYVGMMPTEQVSIPTLRSPMEAFKNYAIYQPFTAALRGLVPDPQQAIPIGLNGGRLAEALDEIMWDEDGDIRVGGPCNVYLDEILDLIDWAGSISVGNPTKERVNAAIPVNRSVLEFKDRYLQDKMRFTAYDASEGALYVLFMYCLALHPKAPSVFAVDNFDQAMHPRLARSVIQRVAALITSQKKTVFLTTHNPLVLDGLDLKNDNIRLFAMDRSQKNGYVTIHRVEVTSDLILEKQPLSQLWTTGRIGGVPNLL